MGDWKILIADDDRSQRFAVSELVERQRPGLEQIRVANPAQAKLFFDQNRDKGCSLCIISDGEMSSRNFDGTDIAIPSDDAFSLGRTNYKHLVQDAKDWQRASNSNTFLVRRSANDKESTDLDDLKDTGVNNFQDPFILAKHESGQAGYLRRIIDHCDELFNLKVSTN